jgi:hypothetical protein
VHFVVVFNLTRFARAPPSPCGLRCETSSYAGIVDVTGYGARGKRGDFEPLISEDLFYRVPAVLSGRVPSTTPEQRPHPDFPLRAFVRCESCGRSLTDSWSEAHISQPNWRFANARPEPALR